MTTKHTPGPWVARESNTYTRDRFVIRPAHPTQGSTLGFAPLCAVEGDVRLIDAATREANARLIAAAPELLEALQAMARAFSPHPREDTEGWREEHEACDSARAAIAKATGAA